MAAAVLSPPQKPHPRHAASPHRPPACHEFHALARGRRRGHPRPDRSGGRYRSDAGGADRIPPDDGVARDRAGATAGAPAAGVPAAQYRGPRRCGDRRGNEMLPRERQDTLFSRAAGAALQAGRVCDMRSSTEGAAEFERRARQLLLESVEGLPAETRSRLTRARYAALSSPPSWSRNLTRHWIAAGAGALAAAVLAVMFMVMPRADSPTVNPLASAAPEDLEMLADSDAVQLGRDDDVDYDFYEWAVGEAKGVNVPSIGS